MGMVPFLKLNTSVGSGGGGSFGFSKLAKSPATSVADSAFPWFFFLRRGFLLL
jgi:hypothetical protein